MGIIRESMQDNTSFSFDIPNLPSKILVDDINKKVIIKEKGSITILSYIEYSKHFLYQGEIK